MDNNKTLQELVQNGLVEFQDNQDGSKKMIQKQFEVKVIDGTPTAVEKEPIVQPRLVKEDIDRQELILQKQIEDIRFIKSQWS